MVQNFITVQRFYYLRRMRGKALIKIALLGIFFFNMNNRKQFLLMTKKVSEE